MENQADNLAAAFKAIADEAPSVAALIDVNDDYRILWANRQLRELLKTAGVAPEGMRWGGRCPFAFGINATEVMDEVARTGKPATLEERPFGARVSTRFGETTYWNWKVFPAPTPDCSGCVAAIADNVTDKVARKASQHRHDPHLSGVVLELPVGVATLDPKDLRILDANDIWLSYLPPEHQTRDSLGRTLPECLPYFQESGLAAIFAKVVSTREVFAARELEVRDPTRGSIWWNMTLRFVQLDESREALLMTLWEVTEQVNARRKADNSRRRAQALLRVQQAITASLALDEILAIIADSTREQMGCDAAAVFMLADGKGSFVPVGSSGVEISHTCAVRNASDASLAARAIQKRRAVSLAGEHAAELTCLPLLEGGKEVHAIAAAPIEAKDKVIGVVEVYSTEKKRFGNDEMETLYSLASSASTAIVNARLFSELQDRNNTIESDRKVLTAILEAIPEAVAVADPAFKLVQANEAARALYAAEEGEELSLAEMMTRTSAEKLDGTPLPPDEHPLALALEGETIKDFEYVVHEPGGEKRFRIVSSAPVRDSDGRIIYSVTVGRDITKQKEELERERRIAKTLQDALMHDLPSNFDSFQIATRHDVGLNEAEIGGDFYDIFSPQPGKLALVIGDVAGKGLSAAIQIAAAKYGVRSYAYDNPDPSYVVGRVNDAMYREPPTGGFVTLFYALLDVEADSYTVSYANAGHEPPLLRRTDKTVERLLSDGIVLGVAPGYNYQVRKTELRVGDKLLLYTDGISEARKESGEMLGEDRLSAYWAECTCEDAESALEYIYSWAWEFSEQHFHDDVAVAVIGRT